MSSTPHQSLAAVGHFVESERILASLPLATNAANGTSSCSWRSSTRFWRSPRPLLGEGQAHAE